MAKGFSEGRSPNDRSELVVLPDGSTWDPGWVQFPDGTQAAIAERQYQEDAARQARDAAAERVNARGPVDGFTDEWRQQRAELGHVIRAWRSVAQDQGQDDLIFGRVVTLNANQRTQGIYTPELKRPETWTIYVQPQLENDGKTPFAGQGYGHGDMSSLFVFLQWAIGGCVFQRTQVIQSATVTRFQVVARKVMIDLTAFKGGDPTLGGQTFNINLAVACGQENEIFGTCPLWISPNNPGGPSQNASQVLLPNANIPIAQGSLMSAVVIAKTVPGAGGPWYPMFFNQKTAPINGDQPLVVLPPIAAAGGTSTLDDEFVTSIDFDIGLAFGFSTTPDIFTAPAAGSALVINYKVGT